MNARIQHLLGVLGASAACLSTVSLAQTATASETRQYVVAWVYYANAQHEGDCPQGLNPNSEAIFRRILEERNTPPAEIEKQIAAFPNSANMADIPMRGMIDGKPANAYMYPTSTKDPMLKLVQGKTGLGFNLDGKDGANNFVDPYTGETGVDNQFFRAIGCSPQMRTPAGQIGSFQAVQWDEIRDSQPAWLIQITGIDSTQNDDDVELRVMLAREPVLRDMTGAAQADITFRVNPIERTQTNVVHGKIKDGLLTTDTFNFYMPGEPFAQADYTFRNARMRFKFEADGNLKGFVGGYQDWRTLYASIALGGTALETLVSYDIPGLFYAFRKSADAYPDPKTGQNTHISSTYAIDAIPAFIADVPKAQASNTK